MSDSLAPITLSLGATRDMLLIVRLTAAGVLTRAGLTMEQTDRFKLAAEEACGCYLTQPEPPERLSLCFTCEDGCLRLTVAAAGGSPVDPDEAEVMRCILASLCDRAELTLADDRISAITLSTCVG